MMNRHSIIFTGPHGAGKTTAIRAISDTPPLKTDVFAGQCIHSSHSLSPAAMVYGFITLPDGEKLHLYGVPLQEGFDHKLAKLIPGGLGLVLLLDNSRADPFKDLNFFLDSFEKFLASANVAVGITHMDLNGIPAIADYHRQLQGTGLRLPIFAVDARVKNDVSLLVQALLFSLDPGLSE